MNEIRVSTLRVTEHIITEAITVAPGVEVQRVTTQRRPDGREPTSVVQERVVGPPSRDGHYCVVEPELLESLRVSGWFNKGETERMMISGEPFTRVRSGKPYRVVQIDYSEIRLFDVDGGRLPVAMWFDYCGVSECNFDLVALAAMLQSRPDVEVERTDTGDPLLLIPYYNRSVSNRHGLEFHWRPDTETFRQYCAMGWKPGERRRAALTFLGCDQFRREATDE